MEGDDTNDGETELCTQDEEADSFIWDQSSQLYYHPRSGFYHDPNAGWYYSTKDGLYYKFEDGNYILLDSSKDCPSEIKGPEDSERDESRLPTSSELEYDQNNRESEYESNQTGHMECSSSIMPENPRPPSEWLEDTLIELYLSGYSNVASNEAVDPTLPKENDGTDDPMLSADGNNELDQHGPEVSWEEESWQAQYGQVVQQEAEPRLAIPILDMWDWSVVEETQKGGKSLVTRLVGKLVQPSAKVHPSMPSQRRRLRTAPICKVHLNLVQVRSGQVYKLKSPNAGYLATLSSYDAANPTKEWDFPDLSIEETNERRESITENQSTSQLNASSCLDKPSANKKHKTPVYRDRAAKRRAFQREFGEKQSADDMSTYSPPGADSVEIAAAEALEMSLGADSYAQKILKNMGWKEGEGLGKTQQGLKEPLQGIGNKGTLGLGWQYARRKYTKDD